MTPRAKPNVPLTNKPRRHRRSVIENGPDPIDIHVGVRIRTRRVIQGVSQTRLGELIGLTFQQVQKYEHGANRVSASMLFRIGKALGVPVAFFFEELPEGQPPALLPMADDMLERRESLALLRNYYGVPETVRKRVYELLNSLNRGEPDDGK